MELTIIAATGGVGHLILEQAVEAGHHVTAVARHTERLGDGVRAVQVDFANPDAEALRSAVQGADAVLPAVGPRKASEAGMASRATRAVVDAMQAAGTQRIRDQRGTGLDNAITGSSASPSSRSRRWILHPQSAHAAHQGCDQQGLSGSRADGRHPS